MVDLYLPEKRWCGLEQFSRGYSVEGAIGLSTIGKPVGSSRSNICTKSRVVENSKITMVDIARPSNLLKQLSNLRETMVSLYLGHFSAVGSGMYYLWFLTESMNIFTGTDRWEFLFPDILYNGNFSLNIYCKSILSLCSVWFCCGPGNLSLANIQSKLYFYRTISEMYNFGKSNRFSSVVKAPYVSTYVQVVSYIPVK